MSSEVDAVNEMLPVKRLVPLGLQHVLAMYAGAVIVPLIVGGAVGLTPQQLGILVAADLFTSGIATLIQSLGIGPFAGIKLPVVLGVSFTAVAPMIAISKDGGLPVVYGAIIASGIFVLLFSNFFGKILRFFPPVVTGSVVTVIGLSLIPVAINNAAGGMGSPTFGEPVNLALALFTLLFIITVSRYLKGFLQAVAVLLGLVVGTVVAGTLELVNFAEVANSGWVNIITPFYFGYPTFTFNGIVTMCLVAIVSMIESTGVFLGLGKIVEKDVKEKDIVRGLRAEGLAQILGGVFNSFPYTTFSQNVGLVALTQIKSRYVVVSAGIILVLLGLIPKFAALATIIPNAVLGGAMIAMFGMVAVSGIRMLGAADFSQTSNLLIAASAISIGLGTAVVPGIFAKLPELARILFENGIVSGSVTAVLLNIFLNWNQIKSGNHPEMVLPDEHNI